MRAQVHSEVLGILCCLLLTGCFKAPLELQQAIRKQHDEIAQVKLFYNDAMNKLFNEIETLQLQYIDEFERAMIDKYKFKRGADPGTVASDDDLNVVVLIPIQARIHSFADERQAMVRSNISQMKQQYLALNQSIDNIDAVNGDMTVYVDSLIRYKKSQDALGHALLQKVNTLTPIALPSVAAVGHLLTTFESDFAKAASQQPTAPK